MKLAPLEKATTRVPWMSVSWEMALASLSSTTVPSSDEVTQRNSWVLNSRLRRRERRGGGGICEIRRAYHQTALPCC